MRPAKGRRLLVLAALLGCAALGLAQEIDESKRRIVPPEELIQGIWADRGRFGLYELYLDAEGRYEAYSPGSNEPERGRYRLKEGILEMTDAAGKTTRQGAVPGKRNLILVRGDGSFRSLERALVVPYDNSPLEPDLSVLRPSPTGHIAFTRFEVVKGRAGEEVVAQIHVMNGDGSAAAPLIAPRDRWDVREPRFSPDGLSLWFSSTFEQSRSTNWTDVFVADLETAEVRRVTGNERQIRRKPGYGAYAGLLVDTTDKLVKVGADEPTGFLLSWQGGGGRTVGAPGFRAAIPLIPAGEVWVKAWDPRDKHSGDIRVVEIRAGETVEDPRTWQLSNGSRLATEPSVTPDGRHFVALWQHAFKLDVDDKQAIEGSALAKEKRPGYDTIAVFDARLGGQPIGEWLPPRLEDQAKDPAISPDGRFVAFVMGLPPIESVAVIGIEDLAKRRSNARVLVQGRQFVGQGAIGHRDPCWSPDGRYVVFARHQSDLGGNARGDLYAVPSAGGDMIRLTQLEANETVANPCFSPDGRRIAFQRITSKREALNVMDILTLQIRSDIWSLATTGGDLQRLTADGRSADPSWGR